MMKHLKYKFDLDCKIAIYVPSTTDDNKPTDNTDMVTHVMRELTALFGGATATSAMVTWLDETGKTVLEQVTIVYAYASSSQVVKQMGKVFALCEHIKTEMRQESVALEYNGQLQFI